MANIVFDGTILLRNDIIENWTTKNPVMSKAEFGLVTNGDYKGKFKFGDGVTPFLELPYATMTIQEIENYVRTAIGDVDLSEIETKIQSMANDIQTLTNNLTKITNGENLNGSVLAINNGLVELLGFSLATEGQQPRIGSGGKLEWFTPSADTIEGLQAAVEALQTMKADKSAVYTKEETDTKIKAVSDDVYKKGETYNQSEVDGKIRAAVALGLRPKPHVDTVADLPIEGSEPGDFRHVIENNSEYYFTVENTWEEIGGIVDLSNYYTKDQVYAKTELYNKTEMDSKIAEIQSNINGLSDVYVSKEPGKGLSSNDFTTDYKNKVDTSETKVSKLETDVQNIKNLNPQENKIENVKVNGSNLVIADKAVNIPVGDGTNLGVVKSSTDEDKISIAQDGTMNVNKVNFKNIVLSEGDRLVINCGNA